MSRGVARPTMRDGGVAFEVWAPRCARMDLKLVAGPGAPAVMRMARDGDIFRATAPGAGAGTEYFFSIDGERDRPDPQSRFQPKDVHGPSCVTDPNAFAWSDARWRGMPLGDYVIYKLHVGTFTRGGDFASAIERLPHLAALGVTAVELMPVAEFPGGRNWGYDGVHLHAPESSYGHPDTLKRFIDSAHALGLAVIMDVVYNHLGPEGNYLAEFGPYFTDRYKTPWGLAWNYDGPESDLVRDYIIGNALYWLTEFHVDTLRLDAVEEIHDRSATHLLEELAERFHAEARALGREAFLIAESDLNNPRLIRPTSIGGYGLDAQWLDEFHHALRTVATGDRSGYFADFGSVGQVAKAIRDGFVNDGGYSTHRKRRFGASSSDLHGHQFVIFTQNHDQIANASRGRRIASILSPRREALTAALLFSSPGIPMLFMGQERGETTHFQYFVSHSDPGLCKAVTEGRRQEHATFGDDMSFFPPAEPATFESCKLRWDEPEAAVAKAYRELIALRARTNALRNGRKDLVRVIVDETRETMLILRGDPAGRDAMVAANFSQTVAQIALTKEFSGEWHLIFDSADALERGGVTRDMVVNGGEFVMDPETCLIFERGV